MYPYRKKDPPAEKAIPETERNTETGMLLFQVFAAEGAYPVENALVTVTGENGFSEQAVTDESGKTKVFFLSAPDSALSQLPAQGKVYASCSAAVRAAGYLPVVFENIPVFSGITSIQPVSLIPSLGRKQGERVDIVEEEPKL